MQLIMRRLHPRGAANKGICVDADGATLGPDCVLVRRTSRGFRGIERDHADALQKCALAEGRDRDLLFRQSQRIAEALDKGEVALAQIYGLHIPVIDLDDGQLARISRIGFSRGYNPDEPRIPKGNPHGGEWTTGETADGAGGSIDILADIGDGGGDSGSDDGGATSDGGGDDSGAGGDGESDGDGNSNPPATSDGSSGSLEATVEGGDQGNGDGTAPADSPISYKWPDASPSGSAPSVQPPSVDSAPSTLGAPDLGDGAPGATPQADDAQSPSQNTAPPPTGSEPSNAPPPDVPTTQPATTQQINALLRSLATWLGRAMAVLGAVYEFDPEVAAVLTAIEATIWLADYAPKIFSYLDTPKTLAELQNAATRPASRGYEVHHIVEAQKRSSDPQRNAERFGDWIDSRENLVRVPYWRHVEISSWYSTVNEDYNGLSPRDYLRGRSWEEQYEIGLKALRRFGVLK